MRRRATKKAVTAVCVFCVVVFLLFATSVKLKVVCTNYELNSYIGTYIQFEYNFLAATYLEIYNRHKLKDEG